MRVVGKLLGAVSLDGDVVKRSVPEKKTNTNRYLPLFLPVENEFQVPFSFPPLEQDLLRQQTAKQQKGNFDSTSLTMPPSVNKTALHPSGVQ
jgi:hypothetical protein